MGLSLCRNLQKQFETRLNAVDLCRHKLHIYKRVYAHQTESYIQLTHNKYNNKETHTRIHSKYTHSNSTFLHLQSAHDS